MYQNGGIFGKVNLPKARQEHLGCLTPSSAMLSTSKNDLRLPTTAMKSMSPSVINSQKIKVENFYQYFVQKVSSFWDFEISKIFVDVSCVSKLTYCNFAMSKIMTQLQPN